MPTHTAFLSCVLAVFLLLGVVEVGFEVSAASAAEVGPHLPDVNGDGVVDIRDVAMCAYAYGSNPGDPGWNSAADLNHDDKIDVHDIALVVQNFGKNCRSYDFNELSDWNVSSGNWSIQNGTLEGSSNTEGLICAGDVTWKDCTLTAKVKIAADSPSAEAALCVYLDQGNFYWAGLGCWGHRVSISTRVGGVWRELAFSGDAADVERDFWYVLTVKVSGGTIMLYLDGSLGLSMNDSTLVSGSVGIRTWDSHVIIDYVTVIGTIVSQGRPALMGTDDVIATWLMNSNFWTKANMQISTIQPYGGNMLNTLITNKELDYNTPLGTYRNVLIDLRNNLHQRGMLYGLQPWSMDGHTLADSDWTQFQIQVINNYNGLGDRWISEYAKVVQAVQPDLMTVFSEAPGDLASGLASASFMRTYISFCTKAIDAWRAIKPDLTVAVQSLPFWDLKPLINAGGIPRSNVLYALHYYYSYNGMYPPSWHPEMQAYWNGNLNEAKTLLYNHFLTNEGIQDALSHGFKVWFEALGCNVANPNAAVFAKDATDFCKQYDIDYITSGSHPYNGWSWMFNSDGTLNDVGKVMLENMKR